MSLHQRILVTGGSGLVGKALQDIVKEADASWEWKFLSQKDGNLTDPSVVDIIFKSYQPTIVVHLAANVGGLFKNMNARLRMYEDNILMNTYILQACTKYKVSKIIAMLSTCVFPDKVEPLTEDVLHQGPPHPSNEGYAYAKRMIHIHSKIIHHTYQIPCINLVPTNIYGKYDNFHLEDGHVFPCLLRKCYHAKMDGTPFKVLGSGSPLRQFIYNYDLAKIIYRFIQKSITGHHVVICTPPSSHELSIKTLAEKISDALEYTQPIQWDTSFSDGQYKKTVEPSDILKELDITWTPIEVGIQETVQWFEKNYPNVRM